MVMIIYNVAINTLSVYRIQGCLQGCQSEKQLSCFQGNLGKASERWELQHIIIGFSKFISTFLI